MTEIPTLVPFEEKLKSNSPFEITPREAAAMKNRLKEAGCNMEISMEEETWLLFSYKFRNPREQRGIGVTAILGPEKTEKLIDWCEQKGKEGGSGRIGRKDGTEGRGLMQAAADILTIAYFSDKRESRVARRKVLRLNQRVWKGLKRAYKNDPQALKGVKEAFYRTPKPLNPEELASIPQGSLAELWKFLIS